uniref:Putative group i salivary lipocalin n=1 Tax=Rhipicephalus pulchellus TaxID=72859 RepID=L7M8M8_RHIPC
MHFVVIVLFWGIASGTVDYKGRATVKDVLDFFRTGQTIALIRRSYNRFIDELEPRCIKTIVTKHENTSLWFNQSYTYGRKSAEESMIGHVLKKPGMDSAPVMIVERVKESENGHLLRNRATQGRDEQTHMFSRAPAHDSSIDYMSFRIYDFQYYDDREKCAVISFTENSCYTKCELHVWLTGGSGAYHNCLLEYEYLCGHRKYYNLYNHRECKF